MYIAKCQKIDEQIDRFEVVANVLSHAEQRRVDFNDLADRSGHAAHLLKDTVVKIGSNYELLEVRRDHEGTWYSLKVDPFAPPAEEELIEEGPDVETIIERLYRESCDEVNDGLRQIVRSLEELRGGLEPAHGAVLMDACADILRLREKLTRISATGVKRDRETYISEIREDLRDLLGGR